MRIKEVSLSNYARFSDLGPVRFGQYRTVVLGQNNVGKSAFLKAMTNHFGIATNRSDEFSSKFPGRKDSVWTAEISMTGDELRSILVSYLEQGNSLTVPFVNLETNTQESLDAALTHFFANSISFKVCRTAPPYSGVHFAVDEMRWEKTVLSSNTRQKFNAPIISYDSGTGRFGLRGFDASSDFRNLKSALNVGFDSNMLWFRAERLVIAYSPSEGSPNLANDCRNLAAVLASLNGTDELARIIALVRQVIPTVRNVSTRPRISAPSEMEIFFWNDEKAEVKNSISLTDSGSGVGQVLAILTAVVASRSPKVILIDEPNSFLHPGASKALMLILRSFMQHQFVITTHSMELLKSFDPDGIVHFLAEGSTTRHKEVTPSSMLEQRAILSDLGVSLADLTGADHCVWVEGQTEEEVFPYLTTKLIEKSIGKIAFPKVAAVGAFHEKKRLSKQEILDIYRSLTKAVAMVPDLLLFLFDRENRSEDEREDLKRQMKGKIEFLPRYCFENYLLNADAVAEALKDRPTFASSLDAAKVQAWWDAHAAEPKYWRGSAAPRPTTDATWRNEINAAKFLADMVDDLSEGKEKYQKTIDSVTIAKILLDKNPGAFREIADIIESFLKRAASG